MASRLGSWDRIPILSHDLKREDFLRILTEPKHALTKQYAELLATEGVRLEFTPDGIEALADIAHMPGVKDVVDNISIAPLSPFDDGLRLRTMRAIYRDPVLSKYALDPARPIRILVDNGHVTLYGAVDNTGEAMLCISVRNVRAISKW